MGSSEVVEYHWNNDLALITFIQTLRDQYGSLEPQVL